MYLAICKKQFQSLGRLFSRFRPLPDFVYSGIILLN